MRFELKNKKVVIIGLARTGLAAAKCCRALGADVTVLEAAPAPANPAEAAGLSAVGVQVKFGVNDAKELPPADLVIPSPGVAPRAPLLNAAIQRKLPVISEIELAWRLTKRPVIAVTGTNGKTTTAILIGRMLKKADIAADICGNIGFPMIDAVMRPAEKQFDRAQLVVEVSSFQLEFTDLFKPHVAVLLNIAEDHMDWHADFDAYVAAKMKIFQRQDRSDWAIVDADIAGRVTTAAKTIVFGKTGIRVVAGWIIHEWFGEPVKILPVGEVSIRGAHNLANVLAAAAAALAVGADAQSIADVLREFKGIEHRLEPVIQDNGIIFYNDSKATNPGAAITAINTFAGPIILLAGGRNKGNDFECLAKEASGKVRQAILFGEAAGDLEAAFSRYSVAAVEVDSLEKAVNLAVKRAVPGDVVLLAPACASFDMFADYEERGRCFKAAVTAEVGLLGKT